MSRTKPTMKSIADELGVSRSTVSFVLGGEAGRRRINAQTAERIVQRAEQLAPTPLEVPATEWMPAAASFDFADTTARGPVRSRVAHEGRRRTGEPADATRLRRDEDSSISGPPPAPRRVWPWVVAGVVTVVVVAAVVALLWAGLR